MSIEKRLFKRYKFFHEIELKSEERKESISGKVKDISLKFVAVVFKDKVPFKVGEGFEFNINLTEGEPETKIQGKANVEIIRDDGLIVFEFVDLDLDSFTHIKKIIKFNSEKETNFLGELKKMFKNNK